MAAVAAYLIKRLKSEIIHVKTVWLWTEHELELQTPTHYSCRFGISQRKTSQSKIGLFKVLYGF